MFKTYKNDFIRGWGECIFSAKKYPKRSSYDQQKTILKSVFIVTNIARPIWPMHQPTKDLCATLQSVYKPHMGLMGHPIERLGTTQGTYGPPYRASRHHIWDLLATLYTVQEQHMGLMGHPIERLGTTYGTYGPPYIPSRDHTWDLWHTLQSVQSPHKGLTGHPIQRLDTTHGTLQSFQSPNKGLTGHPL